MPNNLFIKSISIQPDRENPFPFNVPSIKNCNEIQFDSPITFFIGDNGTGKSTLLETLGHKLNLPLIGGGIGRHAGFEAARKLSSFLSIDWEFEFGTGFFFRAEDFSAFVDSAERNALSQELFYSQFRGELKDSVIKQMKQSANSAARNMRKDYGQDMQAFSHGEAYLHIMHQRIQDRGIFLLDEPEAALSPSRQLSLIYFILNHIKSHRAQFIIATHSPILMATPGASIYQITDDSMEHVDLHETEHYSITKSFLDNPEVFLRHLE